MGEKIQLEIDFYGMEQASIVLVSDLAGYRFTEGSLVLLAAFALRQLHNLGRIAPTEGLAGDLSLVSSHLGESAVSPSPYGVHIIARKGSPGERRFLAKLDFDDSRALLWLDPIGFGSLGYGVNYFAPKSVLILVQYLASQFAGDVSYLASLARCAQMCASAYRLNKITSINQPALARAIVREATSGQGALTESGYTVRPSHQTSPSMAPSRVTSTPRPIAVPELPSCESCGLPARTKRVHLYQNIGLLIMRHRSEIQGNLCKSCIDRYFWEMTGKTMLLGWWGVISFLLSPFIILNNTLLYISTMGMQRPPIQIGKGPSAFWMLTTVGGFILIFILAISILGVGSTPQAQPASAQETCAVSIIGFQTWVIFRGDGASMLCDQAIREAPDTFRRSQSPPTSPVICRELIEGVEATVVDNSVSGEGGSMVCRSLYESLSE
jgi:hypothetical protein